MVLELGTQVKQVIAFVFYLGASKEDSDQLWVRNMRRFLEMTESGRDLTIA